MNTETSIEDDIITCTPVQVLTETSTKTNRFKKIYNKNNINNFVYYPGELLRPKYPSAFKTRIYDKKQTEVNYLRMICEIIELNNETFRFVNVRTVGTYIIIENICYLKDSVTGHQIELDLNSQFYDKIPKLYSCIMIMGTIKHKLHFEDNKKYVPYIVVKTWEEWSNKINFQKFYYKIRRFRNPQVDETIPIEEEESSSDDMSNDEDFEKTDFFLNLQKDGLLNKNTFMMNEKSYNCSMSSDQDFEKTEFLNNVENNLIVHKESLNETSLFDKSPN